MPKSDSTVTSIRPKIEPVYFESVPDDPSIFSLVNALEGVCTALDRMQPMVGDPDDLDHIAQLSCAAQVLASQLRHRWYGGTPPTKRQLTEARKAQQEWAAARELLAGPAEGQA
jgi:hypothetical protein